MLGDYLHENANLNNDGQTKCMEPEAKGKSPLLEGTRAILVRIGLISNCSMMRAGPSIQVQRFASLHFKDERLLDY